MTRHYKIKSSRDIKTSDPSLEYIKVDSLELPNGDSLEKVVVKRKDGIKILPITTDNKILLINEHRYACQKEVVMMPGGAINNGESHEEAVKRELLEETGCEAKEVIPLFTQKSCSSLVDENRYFYLALGVHKPKEDKSIKDPWESIKLYPIEIKEALKMAKNAEFPHTETNLAIIMAAEKLSKTE